MTTLSSPICHSIEKEEAAVAAATATATATEPAEPTQGYSHDVPAERISTPQWAVTATMCWFAMTFSFILGAWEVNIPIFSARAFGASPFVAGNLIALGGVCTFPFMFANVVLARRVQDRYILAAGQRAGLARIARSHHRRLPGPRDVREPVRVLVLRRTRVRPCQHGHALPVVEADAAHVEWED